MLFYKATFILTHEVEGPKKTEMADIASSISTKTKFFFKTQSKNCHIAVSDINYHKKSADLCIASKSELPTLALIGEFVKYVELGYEQIKLEETTFETYCAMLGRAYENDYFDDYEEVFDGLEITAFERIKGLRAVQFTEAILPNINSKDEVIKKAQNLFSAESLLPEIERVYLGTNQKKSIIGHPVHYMIFSDDEAITNEIAQTLITALFNNRRIQSRRCTQLRINSRAPFPSNAVEALYRSCTGGAVVITYNDSSAEESEFGNIEEDNLLDICALVHQFRNQTLTIFCLCCDAEKTRDKILEQSGAMTFVPIAHEKVFNSKAKDYLDTLAKKKGVEADQSLHVQITLDTGYHAADLKLIFDEWYDRHIKEKYYPQYLTLESVNKRVVNMRAKGSAIVELERMVGLSDAKKIIHQALDFYKAQKLFATKGFNSGRPVMHMIFTGNPGTAKTTVARLFAQIMKDNDLLSVGNLYEVGRADLVGKYVGWTAKLVKEKFEKARGSVLFIDEAYSLVDSKDGLYGDEAINTIVQQMENYREDMVVIFAGYPEKMEAFLQKNPGLRSRIAFHVPFADYNVEELYKIAELMAAKKQYNLGVGVKDKLCKIYESALVNSDFGNGRFVRNVFEKAIMKQASRLLTMDSDAVTDGHIKEICPDDFDEPNIQKIEKPRIGFLG